MKNRIPKFWEQSKGNKQITCAWMKMIHYDKIHAFVTGVVWVQDDDDNSGIGHESHFIVTVKWCKKESIKTDTENAEELLDSDDKENSYVIIYFSQNAIKVG